MFRKCLLSLREQAKKSKWLTKIYRQYFMNLRADTNYAEVIEEQNKLLSELSVNSDSTTFSILVPVYKPQLALFKEMVLSVLEQSYTNWQLVLVDDASEDKELTNYLQELTVLYKQIKVVNCIENMHISAASNKGLAVANGEFIVLLDHDDVLHKEALKTAAYYIDKHPSPMILYSDEDKLTSKGDRVSPHFKPQWNRDLLYSMNYISHLGIYRKSLVDELDGFKVGVEGSQDYDLLLRCVERCNDSQIIHIPYVLYHWRAIRGSTALAESEKSYSAIAGLSALKAHLGFDSVEFGKLANTYKVNWPLPKPMPLVSIIIPTKNAQALVQQCIDSIYQQAEYPHFEILLVDNESDDSASLNYFKTLESEGKVRLLHYDKPFNYSAINNYAVAQAKGELLVLMNNDIEILSNNWLVEVVSNISRSDIGCVGAKLYYPNGTLQHGGVITGIGEVAGHSHKYFPKDHPGYFKRLQVVQNLSAVTAACIGVRKQVYDEVGGLDEKNLSIAFSDVDFCLKVQAAGYRNLWSPYIEMVHHESISRGADDTPENISRFNQEISYMKKKWGEQLTADPCYSPWLSLTKEDFSLK